MNMRSRTAEDWCPCGRVCVYTDMCVCVCLSPLFFVVHVTIGYGLTLVQSNDCESRCSNAVLCCISFLRHRGKKAETVLNLGKLCPQVVMEAIYVQV